MRQEQNLRWKDRSRLNLGDRKSHLPARGWSRARQLQSESNGVSTSRIRQASAESSVVPALTGFGFEPAKTYDSGCYSQSAIVGDLNSDGHPDLVVADGMRAAAVYLVPVK